MLGENENVVGILLYGNPDAPNARSLSLIIAFSPLDLPWDLQEISCVDEVYTRPQKLRSVSF